MRVRLMRGQVVIREKRPEHQGILVIPRSVSDSMRESDKIHRGTVLAMGAPVQMPNGTEIPHGFSVGDDVLFHWEGPEKNLTREWTDGLPACWVPQWAIDGVVSP